MDNSVEHNTTSIKPSPYLSDAFWGLRDHNFLTPNYLSKAWSAPLMIPALPMQAMWVADSWLEYFKIEWIPYLNNEFDLGLDDLDFESSKPDEFIQFKKMKEDRNAFIERLKKPPLM